MPRTSQIINEKLETLEDFMLRKLICAEKQFLKKGKLPTQHQLIRHAGIRNYTTKNSELIQNEIVNSLKRIEFSI